MICVEKHWHQSQNHFDFLKISILKTKRFVLKMILKFFGEKFKTSTFPYFPHLWKTFTFFIFWNNLNMIFDFVEWEFHIFQNVKVFQCENNSKLRKSCYFSFIKIKSNSFVKHISLSKKKWPFEKVKLFLTFNQYFLPTSSMFNLQIMSIKSVQNVSEWNDIFLFPHKS